MTYRMMLVDDDVPMLSYLEQLLPWDELGLRITASACSSVQALRLFKEKDPQLVITDIGLPQMDGVELAMEMKKINPDVRIIFLTCHEDFYYARKAVQISADDYLIKDELDSDKLKESVLKAVSHLDEITSRLEQLSNRIEIQRHKNLLKQSFMKQILSGDDSDSAKQLGLRIGVVWKKNDFLMALGMFDYASFAARYSFKDLPLIRFALYNIAENVALGMDGISVFQDEEGTILLIYNYEKNLAVNAHERFGRYMDQVHSAVQEYIKVRMRVVVSNPFRDVQSIGSVHSRLKQYDSDLYYDSVSYAVLQEWKPAEWLRTPHMTTGVRAAFLSAAREGNPESILELFDQSLAEMKESAVYPSRGLSECSQMIRMIEFELGYQVESESFHYYLLHSGRIEETLELIRMRIRHVMGPAANSGIMFSKTPRLKIIEDYVREHLSENITAVTMANRLFLNPNYFSRYFKKLTGMNFTDYVHRLKMDIAAQMIKNDAGKIEVISMKLGYSDRTYFSKVFKKYNGVTPSEYR
ncbi:response regulator [Paenibacillus sp. MSJ-34]|uniref:response regulator n=1 Tax=Paenibacillus sp. MSJ-34 TaxID=2841529 RepID=UPI001C10C8F4|nr:response regulator [Paenibacillus sp. MSJ-34]MBU5442215.1 response regulator [Paenibacillus sp. MSJ-34]